LKTDEFIERRIVTGLIVSTEYHQITSPFWNSQLLTSPTARLMAGWCVEHFLKYHSAPGRDIEGIYTHRLKAGMDPDKAQDIESILSGLSEDFERGQFNARYLADQTRVYFQEQHLKAFADGIRAEVDDGNITEAEQMATGYTSAVNQAHTAIDPFASAERIKRAFAEASTPLIRLPKALGEFMNSQLVRDGFVAFMGPEKRGKTFLLMELSIRAMKSGCNVVFFQAGDMSEDQQLRRLCVYLAQRSDRELYCRGMFVPVLDCIHNQLDECERAERECAFGVFDSHEKDKLVNRKVTKEELAERYKKYPDYKPCSMCDQLRGCPWVRWREPVKPLTWREAAKIAMDFRKRQEKRFKLCTYPNETLSVGEIKNLLSIWERQEGFVADVIVVDYADIMAPDADFKNLDFRNQINKTWQRLRNLSQERHCLVITATQAAASCYSKDTIGKGDFSEDKRKYAHVTAMYGLNQTEEEKQIGIMRLNELVVREGDFSTSNQIKVLQRLQIGRPVLGSYK